MVQAVGRKFPAMSRQDATITLTVHAGIVIASTTCKAGAVLALATENGQCDRSRPDFTGVLNTFKDEEVLSIQVCELGLKIKGFTMPVSNFSATSVSRRPYEWFGPMLPAP